MRWGRGRSVTGAVILSPDTGFLEGAVVGMERRSGALRVWFLDDVASSGSSMER